MDRKKGLTYFAAAFFLLAFALITFRGYQEVKRYGDIDLRNRIVGARLLQENKPVYFTKFRDVKDERLMDPWDLDDYKVNRITVSPALLILMQPIAPLSHGQIQWLWLTLSLLAYLSVTLLFYLLAKEQQKVWVLVIASFLLFSSGWLLHLERGQIYIFYTLLLSLAFFFHKKKKPSAAGFTLIIMVFLRPSFIVLLPLLFLFRKRSSYLKGMLVSTILCIGLSIAFTDTQTWIDYFSSMKEWSLMQTDRGSRLSNYTHPPVPEIIEGQSNLTLYNRSIPFSNSSIQGYIYEKSGLIVNELLLLIIFGIAYAVLFYKNSTRLTTTQSKDTALLYLGGFLSFIFIEYCSPAPRYSYQFVYWIFPLMLLSVSYPLKSVPRLAILMIVCGITLNLGFAMASGEYLMFSGMLIVLLRSYAGAEGERVIKRKPVP